jgi:hypothetical protein
MMAHFNSTGGKILLPRFLDDLFPSSFFEVTTEDDLDVAVTYLQN